MSYLNYMLIQQQQKKMEISNQPTSYLTNTSKASSKKRCLSELQSKHYHEIFESAKPPLPILLNNLPKDVEYEAKVFRNRVNCHQQIFTYIHLVICFEVKKSNSCSVCLDHIYELIQKPEFQLIFSKQSELNGQSQIKIKNILSQYLNQLNLGLTTVLKSLKKYPLILQIFVSFYRTLLILGDAATSLEQIVPMTETYDFLASYFDIEMEIGVNYLYFPEAHIYVNEKSSDQVFMIIPLQAECSLISNRLQHSTVNKSLYDNSKLVQISPNKNGKRSRKNSIKISLQQRADLIQRIKLKIEESHQQIISRNEIKSRASFNNTQSEPIQGNQKDISFICKKSPLHEYCHQNIIIGSKQSKKDLHAVCFQTEPVPIPHEAQIKPKKQPTPTHYRNKSDNCEKVTNNKQNYPFFSQLFQQRQDTKTEKMLELTAATRRDSINQRKSYLKQQQLPIEKIFYRPVYTAKIQSPSWKTNSKPWVNPNFIHPGLPARTVSYKHKNKKIKSQTHQKKYRRLFSTLR